MAAAASALRYDVIVVGAGPAGAAAAIALQQRGLSVVLIERSRSRRAEWPEGGGAARALRAGSVGESLSAAAQFPLQELGLWDEFERGRHRATYLTQSAWGSEELRERSAIQHRLGPDYHLDRRVFDAWLRARATAQGAELVFAKGLTGGWDENRSAFLLSGLCSRGADADSQPLAFEAPYAIDASGRSTWLTLRLGGTRQRGAAPVCAARVYEGATFEPSILVETAPEGWWYSAPLPDSRTLALHLMLPETAHGARHEDSWQRLLAQAPRTAYRLSGAVPAGSVRTCSATPQLSSWNSRLPFLPVGDAATAFDPVSGSGLCFAFRSALEAATVVDEARSGRSRSFIGYQEGVRNVFEQHLRRRSQIYRHEQRWPGAAFWICVQS